MPNVPSIIEPDCTGQVGDSTISLVAQSIYGDPDPSGYINTVTFSISKNSQPSLSHEVVVNAENSSVTFYEFPLGVDFGDSFEWSIVATSNFGAESCAIGSSAFGKNNVDSQVVIGHVGAFGVVVTEDLEEDGTIVINPQEIDGTNYVIIANKLNASVVQTTDLLGDDKYIIISLPIESSPYVIIPQELDGSTLVVEAENLLDKEGLLINTVTLQNSGTVIFTNDIEASLSVIQSNEFFTDKNVIISEEFTETKGIITGPAV